MNKTEFVKEMADRAELANKDAAKALDAFIEVVTDTLAKEEDVTLPGFGSFSVSERKARTARDFRSGKTIDIAACKVAKFKAGKQLKEAVK